MRSENVPSFGARYWTALSIASIFGANLGDFVSHNLHLGHVRGLLPLALIFAAVVIGERRSARRSEAWYWTAIVLARTAATNLADLGTHDLHLPYAWVIVVLETLLVLLALPGAAKRVAMGAGVAGKPSADGWYWAAMLVAGTLGTAIGDCTADVFGFGVGYGTVLLGAVLAVVLGVFSRSGWASKAAYWISVVSVRAAGTTAGDFLAGHHGAALGLPLSTTLSGAALVGILLLWRRKPVQAPAYT